MSSLSSAPLATDLSSSDKSNSLSLSSYSTFSSNSLKSGANADQFSTWFCAQTLTTPAIESHYNMSIKYCAFIYVPEEILAIIGLTGCHATSRSNSPFVPWSIFTKFPILFSQIYRACCLAEPAHIYSPSPEKQHFFHMVLKRHLCTYTKQSAYSIITCWQDPAVFE